MQSFVQGRKKLYRNQFNYSSDKTKEEY